MDKEQEKNGLKIPDRFLREPEQIEVDENEATAPFDGFVSDLAEKSLSKFAGVFDEVMKERGGVGLADVNEDDFAKFGYVALEDMVPKEVLENSPKAAFGIMCTYIGAANAIAIKRSNSNKSKEDNGQNKDG